MKQKRVIEIFLFRISLSRKNSWNLLTAWFKMYWMEITAFLFMNLIFWITMFYPNWDFMAYFLNGKYFFDSSIYFEIYRAPFVPLYLGILFTFTRSYILTALLYSLLTSIAFVYAANSIIKTYNLNKYAYYLALFTTPLLWYVGLRIGTELISLTLLLFFLASIKTNKNIVAGLSLSFASLSRYELLILTPLLLTTTKIKDLIIRITAFSIPWIIWAYYNYITWGSPTYSFLNSYALNIYFRDYLWQSPNPLHFLTLGGSLIGSIYYAYIRLKEKIRYLSWKHEIILLYFIMALLYSYYTTPLKFDRYLYTLIAPLSIFSALGLKKALKHNKKTTYLIIGMFLLFTLIAYSYALTQYRTNKTIFERINTLQPFINESEVYYSDLWVHLNFHNISAVPVEQLCRDKELIVDPTKKYAIIFNNNFCLNKDITLINETYNHVKIYKIENITSSSNTKKENTFYLDYLREVSVKIKKDVTYEVCISLFKSPFICRKPII